MGSWRGQFFTQLLANQISIEKIVFVILHTTLTVRNKHEKLEGKGEASFDTPFMIQSHVESIKKIVGAFLELPAN